MKKYIVLSIAAIWSLSSSAVFAAAVVFNFDSGGFFLQNSAGVNLTGGAILTPFDGEVVQIGYFSAAGTTDNNNFAGTWIPITGEGSVNYAPNTKSDTSVGDLPGAFDPPNNQFSSSVTYNTANGDVLPQVAVGTRLSIRVYDRATLLGSTSFVTFSNNLWRFPTPGNPTDTGAISNLSLGDPGLRVENRDGAGGLVSTPNGSAAAPDGSGNLRTNIAIVPEPSCSVLAFAGCFAYFARRRK